MTSSDVCQPWFRWIPDSSFLNFDDGTAPVGGLEALDEMVILGILLALNFRVLLVSSVMTRLVLFLGLTCRYDCAIEEVN